MQAVADEHFHNNILAMKKKFNIKIGKMQGHSDGVSRVSNAYGSTAEGAHKKDKIYTTVLPSVRLNLGSSGPRKLKFE